MQNIIKNKISELRDLCLSLGVQRLYVFGSAATNEFNSDSDIDFLISFSKSLSIKEYTENYFSLQYKLRDLFSRNIDLVTEQTLSNPYFIESINESKQLIYEA
jgi:predicted nucleotidyltransferase